jgi:hypothetical protein
MLSHWAILPNKTNDARQVAAINERQVERVFNQSKKRR